MGQYTRGLFPTSQLKVSHPHFDAEAVLLERECRRHVLFGEAVRYRFEDIVLDHVRERDRNVTLASEFGRETEVLARELEHESDAL